MITKYDGFCIICGRPTSVTHHLVEGVGKRDLSEKWGLTCPLCPEHHNMGKNSVHLNPAMNTMSKIIGQLAFEKQYYADRYGAIDDEARESFRAIFGKSFL